MNAEIICPIRRFGDARLKTGSDGEVADFNDDLLDPLRGFYIRVR